MKRVIPAVVLVAACTHPHLPPPPTPTPVVEVEAPPAAPAAPELGAPVTLPPGWTAFVGDDYLSLSSMTGATAKINVSDGLSCDDMNDGEDPVELDQAFAGGPWRAMGGAHLGDLALCLDRPDTADSIEVDVTKDVGDGADYTPVAVALAPIAAYVQAWGELPPGIESAPGSLAWLSGIAQPWSAYQESEGTVLLSRVYDYDIARIHVLHSDGDCASLFADPASYFDGGIETIDAPYPAEGWSAQALALAADDETSASTVMCKDLGDQGSMHAEIYGGDEVSSDDVGALLTGLAPA